MAEAQGPVRTLGHNHPLSLSLYRAVAGGQREVAQPMQGLGPAGKPGEADTGTRRGSAFYLKLGRVLRGSELLPLPGDA